MRPFRDKAEGECGITKSQYNLPWSESKLLIGEAVKQVSSHER